MGKPVVDYSLYLVTDSTPAILGDKSLNHVVEESLKGGVTLVQLREKKGDTGELIEIGRQLHQITRKYNVPLLINDRVDVALAVGCEGVHIGQDDMGESKPPLLTLTETDQLNRLVYREETSRRRCHHRSHCQQRRPGPQGLRGRR